MTDGNMPKPESSDRQNQERKSVRKTRKQGMYQEVKLKVPRKGNLSLISHKQLFKRLTDQEQLATSFNIICT